MKKPNPDQIKDILFSSAEDLKAKGIDVETGHGRLTTDFIDMGRVIDDTDPGEYKDDLSGCRGALAGLAIGALIWVLLIALIYLWT